MQLPPRWRGSRNWNRRGRFRQGGRIGFKGDIAVKIVQRQLLKEVMARMEDERFPGEKSFRITDLRSGDNARACRGKLNASKDKRLKKTPFDVTDTQLPGVQASHANQSVFQAKTKNVRLNEER
jgi:hypothetical protein